MATYVYGVTRSRVRAPGGEGLHGAPVRKVRAGTTAALVSDLTDEGPTLGRDELLRHSRVLERASACGTVLPMRFGLSMASDEDVRERLLVRHGVQLSRQLDGFAGTVELDIRAVYEERTLLLEVLDESPEVAARQAQLRELPAAATHFARIDLGRAIAAEVDRKRDRDARALLDALSPLAGAVEVGPPSHARVVFSAAFLVARRGLRAFDRALEGVAAEQAGRMRFKYTGPLPPYSFVALDADA